MRLYTIGFTQKSAETFFGLLREHGVQRLVDIRVHPSGQLAGFAKQGDLPYFLDKLAAGCQYVYLPDLAPTAEIMVEYRKTHDWSKYAARFKRLMDKRQMPAKMDRAGFEQFPSCLLCSEATAEKCHRRLVAERIAEAWGNVEVVHL